MAETIALWKYRRKQYINLLQAKENNTSMYFKQTPLHYGSS